MWWSKYRYSDPTLMDNINNNTDLNVIDLFGCTIGYDMSISKAITEMLFRNRKSPKPLTPSILNLHTYYNLHVISYIECYLPIPNF